MDTLAYEALHENAALLDLSARGRIRMTGEDRARLLHAMSTNHIQGLQPGQGCYAFLLNDKGRVLADLIVINRGADLLLSVEPAQREFVRQHLDKFIIADDVQVEDVTDSTIEFAIEGPKSDETLRMLGAELTETDYHCTTWQDAQIVNFSYTGGTGFRVIAPAGERDRLIDALQDRGVAAATLDAANLVRIEHHRPLFGTDFSDANLPQETGLMHAISFQKGCYLGQEIVERIRARGHVNRTLTGFALHGQTAPARGTKVLVDGKEAGEITSAAYSPRQGRVVALGILRAEFNKAGAEVTVDGLTGTVAGAGRH